MTTPTSGSALRGNRPASRGKIFAWALWDWGTQPYATVVTTFVFAVYITSSYFGSENHTNIALAVSTGAAGFFIAVLAPVLGQSADRNGRRMASLRYATWALAAVTAALYFVKPEPGYLYLGLVLLAVGAVVAEIGNVNYYALLDDIATDKNVGRISGLGWGLGYLGGIFALLGLNFGLIAPEVGLFGASNEGATDIRISMVLCAVWTLLFTIPLFLTIRDKPLDHPVKRLGIVDSYRALFRSIVQLWRTSRTTAYFLLASALFRDGLAGVFTFGAVIAAGTFRMSAGEVIIFGAAASVVAGIATIVFGYLDDWVGPKVVIMFSLISMVLVGIAIFVFGAQVTGGTINPATGKSIFWGLGLGLTVFVGPAQSASRSYLARLIPEGKSGEIFGLYVTTGRAVSFFAPSAYGLAIVVGSWITGQDSTQYFGILGVISVLALGAVCMAFVPGAAREQRS